MRRPITILGSTGSIGRSALEVVNHLPDRLEVVALTGHRNVELMAEQVRAFRPRYAAMADADAAKALHEAVGGITTVLSGLGAIEDLAREPVNTVLCAMVGAAGLTPVMAAIEAGNRVALANKEPLVIAGGLIMEAARRKGVEVLPVDSEHNAIFQCLHGHGLADVHAVMLTASGGPFYQMPREALRAVTPEQAAKHPTWDMGVKVSVDSATLMNKGLEIVEAMWLFGLPLDKIHPVIHPQSIIHGLVEFTDGHIMAHLGPTDMKCPIQFALTWPERVESPVTRLNLAALRALTFAEPDFSEFPCLKYAIDAARAGGTAPALLNAANETAVAAFCRHEIGFLEIPDVIAAVMESESSTPADSLEAVIAADRLGRERATTIIKEIETRV
jgi:1-deoxy-D-xylulose-5-phosphate reductoisomerase